MFLGALLTLGNAGCFFQHHANTNPLAAVKSNQPDKTLFDIAMADLDKGKYTVARLNLETLLNTYPDSEYLARAKMAIADTWFREGGTEGMAQAEAQYKDFITFFPQMKEASEAQLKVAEIHYRQLEKPDRDPTEASRAQAELRTFLINYPDSPLRPQAVQMLRDTQEVLAEGEYRVGEFYMQRAEQGEYTDYRAAQNRLQQVLNTYPLYSQGDIALDELARSYVTTSRLYAGAAEMAPNAPAKQLDQANEQADRQKAVAAFDQLATRYPLSPMAKDAAKQLTALKEPVPKPSEDEIAFNRAEIAGRQSAPKAKGLSARLDLPAIEAVWSGRPSTELLRADKVGTPALTEPALPPPDALPGLDTLLRQTMIATGAIAANATPNVNVSATLTGTGAPPAVAAKSPTTAVGALQLQDVTSAKPRGADTPESSTPQAVSGNNNNDPNAHAAVAAADPNLILTPNELDLETRDQLLAAAIHREIPAPLPELKADAKRRAEAQAQALAEFKKEQAAGKLHPAAPVNGQPPAASDTSSTPPKKSIFSRIFG
ncbi:MAG: outer membrane protein assembly factor BamD [Terriglobales bacterium]